MIVLAEKEDISKIEQAATCLLTDVLLCLLGLNLSRLGVQNQVPGADIKQAVSLQC